MLITPVASRPPISWAPVIGIPTQNAPADAGDRSALVVKALPSWAGVVPRGHLHRQQIRLPHHHHHRLLLLRKRAHSVYGDALHGVNTFESTGRDQPVLPTARRGGSGGGGHAFSHQYDAIVHGRLAVLAKSAETRQQVESAPQAAAGLAGNGKGATPRKADWRATTLKPLFNVGSGALHWLGLPHTILSVDGNGRIGAVPALLLKATQGRSVDGRVSLRSAGATAKGALGPAMGTFLETVTLAVRDLPRVRQMLSGTKSLKGAVVRRTSTVDPGGPKFTVMIAQGGLRIPI